MAGTPVSKLIETIKEVEVIQGQIEALTDIVERLVSRVDAIEKSLPSPKKP